MKSSAKAKIPPAQGPGPDLRAHHVRQTDDLERILEFDFIRATEAAALHVLPWRGRGNKEAADAAACDALRGMFDLMHICGEVVIGEGIKDDAPGIFKGEQLGRWREGDRPFDIAVDPVDGTTNLSKGAPNSLAVLAAASPEEGVDVALQDVPSFYMMKLAYGPRVKEHAEKMGIDCLKLEQPLEESLALIARALRKRLQDLVVCVLERPRHVELVARVRAAGCSLHMITDGDISAAIAPALPGSGIDVYVGIGGATEAVLAAAALKCLGGEIQARMWPRDEAERKQLAAAGYEEQLSRVYYSDDLARGKNIIFCATGITESPLLPGVTIENSTAITHSILMRARHKTVRYITAHHNLKEKTIRLRSDSLEHSI